MKVDINYEKKEIEFSGEYELHEFAHYLVDNFPEEKWREFKIIIHE